MTRVVTRFRMFDFREIQTCNLLNDKHLLIFLRLHHLAEPLGLSLFKTITQIQSEFVPFLVSIAPPGMMVVPCTFRRV